MEKFQALETLSRREIGMNVLSGKGRINRVQFLVWMLVIFSVVGLIVISGGFDGVHSDDDVVFGWILLLVMYVLSWAPMVRRLHDVNQSQAAYWVAMLIPGGYVVAFIYLLLRKGVQESNRYAKESKFNWFGLDKKTAIFSSDDDAFYQQAYEELENGQVDKALWAKIFAQCDGDESQAKALYIRSRVMQLKPNSFDHKNTVAESENKSVAASCSKKVEQNSSTCPPLTSPIMIFLAVAAIAGLIYANWWKISCFFDEIMWKFR